MIARSFEEVGKGLIGRIKAAVKITDQMSYAPDAADSPGEYNMFCQTSCNIDATSFQADTRA